MAVFFPFVEKKNGYTLLECFRTRHILAPQTGKTKGTFCNITDKHCNDTFFKLSN